MILHNNAIRIPELTFLPCLSAGQLTLLRFAGDVPVLRMTGEDEPDDGGKEEIESILIKVAGCIPPSHLADKRLRASLLPRLM